MKDLIAKLQMDANCALGAIWMHIDAQAARIAELEAQIAAASAPVVEQQPLGYIPKWAHDMLTGEMGGMSDWGCNAHIYAAEAIGHIPIYTAPRITDPDKLREAIANISNNQITEAWESCGGVDGFYKSFGYQQFAHAILDLAADTVASTALQAPVSEVPGWQPIETAPKDGQEILIRYPLQGNVKQLASYNTIHNHWQSKGGYVWAVEQKCEWHPLPDDLPAAPVQKGGE